MINLLKMHQKNHDLKVHESEPARTSVQNCSNSQIHMLSTSRRSRQSSKKAQFMIVTMVLIGLAFFTIFLLTRTVDRSSAVMFTERDSDFDNLKNAIVQRNSWAGSGLFAEFCSHMQNITMASGGKLECGPKNLFGAGKVNYSINYTTLDFSYTGFLN